jgi:radical SAM superfamily enzyme YgiQ (UPF0313 family)
MSTISQKVLLISMPFGPIRMPSLALSLLKAGVERRGFTCTVHYFNLAFANLIGLDLYDLISEGFAAEELLGESLFSSYLFGNSVPPFADYFEHILHAQPKKHASFSGKRPRGKELLSDLERARSKVPEFLNECASTILDATPIVIGFTSVFQQHVASLALARLIKRMDSRPLIIFGGANCEDVMGRELLKQVTFVDAVAIGEADESFPAWVDQVASSPGTKPNVEGIIWADKADLPRHVIKPQSENLSSIDACVRDNEKPFFESALVRILQDAPGRAKETPNASGNAPALNASMDWLPVPDYSDYFSQLKIHKELTKIVPSIPFETSRGCWWGEKHHCTFCGLNGQTMKSRNKSAGRAINELTSLARRHPGCRVLLSDNILPFHYFDTFLPELAKRNLGLEMFCEVKANLKKSQLRQLRNAGITAIQPGIESFSNEVLALMRKGVNKLQNVQLLKWCKELGIHVEWNLLWGFPGESADEYATMKDLIPTLFHLQPPSGAGPIRMDRFSPNFVSAGDLGFNNVKPCPAYAYVYPFSDDALKNIAYYFAFDYVDGRQVDGYTADVARLVKLWQEQHQESDLFSIDKGTCLLIWDFRPFARRTLTVLTGIERALYIAGDQASSLRELSQTAEVRSERVDGPCIEAALNSFVDDGLALKEGGRFLSLAVPIGDYTPPTQILRRILAHSENSAGELQSFQKMERMEMTTQ